MTIKFNRKWLVLLVAILLSMTVLNTIAIHYHDVDTQDIKNIRSWLNIAGIGGVLLIVIFKERIEKKFSIVLLWWCLLLIINTFHVESGFVLFTFVFIMQVISFWMVIRKTHLLLISLKREKKAP